MSLIAAGASMHLKIHTVQSNCEVRLVVTSSFAMAVEWASTASASSLIKAGGIDAKSGGWNAKIGCGCSKHCEPTSAPTLREEGRLRPIDITLPPSR